MRIFFIILFFLWGCEEPDRWEPCEETLSNYDVIPLWIDNACFMGEEQTVINLIQEAVIRLNNMTSSLICQPRVEIVGSITVEHDIKELPLNTLACYNSEPGWYAGTKMENHTGWGAYNESVRLFWWKANKVHPEGLNLIMHELGHYVHMGHAKQPAVMNRKDDSFVHYNDIDADKFCEYHNCVNW